MAGPGVLVTGGTGFLGRAVLRQLREAGYETQCLQRTGSSDWGRTISGDIRDHAAVSRALAGMGAVIHTAGLAHVFHTPRDTTPRDAAFADINVQGTETVARAAISARVRHFILISSVAVYGSGAAGALEDVPGRPIGAYAMSKAAAERRAIETLDGSPVRLTILRAATLYGEGDRGNVQRLLDVIDRGRFVWIGRGSNHKSLIHVDDAARACVLPLAHDGNSVEIYNVSAPPVTMRAVVEGLADAAGRRLPSWQLPAGLALATATALRILMPGRGRVLHETLVKWLSDEVYPGDKFASRFDFEPRVQLTDGLSLQVAWWRQCRAPSCSC
jgi:nucleoside-diphosphate-sugar epimerase